MSIRRLVQLEHWWVWLLLIIALRLALMLFISPPPTVYGRTVDELLPLAAHSTDGEVRELAWQSLRHIAIRYPQERSRMIERLRLAQDHGGEMACRLEGDAELVLRQAAAGNETVWLVYLQLVALCLCGSAVALVALAIPLLLYFAGGGRGLAKVFGRRVRILLIGVASALAGSSVFYWLGLLPAAAVQAVWCACALSVLHRLIHAGMLVALLGIPQYRMSRLFTLAFIGAVVSLLPHLWPRPAAAPQMAPQQIISAIRQAAQDQQTSVVPQLLALIRRRAVVGVAANDAEICQQALICLGKLGDETIVPELFVFARHPYPPLQKAALRALQQIWQKK